MRKAILWIGLLLLGLGAGRPVEALTQRRINTLAACLYQTNHALVEETGIRLPAEPLPAYFDRLLALQSGEKPAARHARVAGYLTLLEQAADRTAGIRKAPALKTDSPANRALWQQINLNVRGLPSLLAKARAGWAQEENRHGTPSATARAITQTIWHIQNAYAALRDALP